jgi:GTP-binding protein HflX
MKTLHETEEQPKRVFLVGIRDRKTSAAEAASLSRELAGLTATLGLETAGEEIVHVRENSPRYGVGAGKAAELAEKAADAGAACLVFDRDLSPSQQRNWEELAGIPAVDRQELIIKIFADRAKTREAELQAGLAALNYALPRLQHKYIDLSRQRGGRYGTRGAGETRLETDRRQLERRIHRLEQELAEVRKQREVQRKKRERGDVPVCALVGYTNAGKSSLLKALTGAEAYAEDRLFATLDTETRRFRTPAGRTLVLVDTVGFIRRLPHALVDAFRGTLEEAVRADLLVQVLDASDEDADRYYQTTLGVLRDLGADTIPRITALNKIDRLPDPAAALEDLQRRYAEEALPGLSVPAIPLSARERRGLEELKGWMDRILFPEG